MDYSSLDNYGLIKMLQEAEKAQAAIKKEISDREQHERDMENEIITSSPIGQLAIKLHNKICNYNHTDGCGWYYEVSGKKEEHHDWNGHSHARYLDKAKKLSNRLNNKIDVDTFFECLKIVREI